LVFSPLICNGITAVHASNWNNHFPSNCHLVK
jgi:hypothetical protein